MKEVCTIGLELAKNVFQVHGVDGSGEAVIHRQLRRGQVLPFFKRLPPCLVAWILSGHSPSSCRYSSMPLALNAIPPHSTYSGKPAATKFATTRS